MKVPIRLYPFIAILVSLDWVQEVSAKELPDPKKPFFGCAARLANAKDLANALWCIDNKTEESDPKFWKAAQEKLVSVLGEYEGGDSYVEKLGAASSSEEGGEGGGSGKKTLPTPKKPMLGCSARLVKASDLANALWCVQNKSQESDPNFWTKAQADLPGLLQGYDGANVYLTKLNAGGENSSGPKTLPEAKKPMLGCAARLASAKNLPNALWCMDNTTNDSDPNFWKAAKEKLIAILQGYDGGDVYVAKINAGGGDGSGKKTLPTPKKPMLGCAARLASNPKDLANALWCIDNTDDASDPNFWDKARNSLPNILNAYDGGDAYITKLAASGDAPDGSLTLPAPEKPGLLGCTVNLVKNKNLTKKNMAQVIFCANKNTEAIKNGEHSFFPDPNFVRTAVDVLPKVLKQYKGGMDYYESLEWP